MSDYQSAKQVLLKAWKLKSPDEDEHENIESNLKVGKFKYSWKIALYTN